MSSEELLVATASGRALETVQKHSGDKPLVLYSGWYCPFVQRLWIALELKGLDYQYVEVDPYKKAPEFLALNPNGLVPTLAHNGRVLYESLVCLEFLEDEFSPTPALTTAATATAAAGAGTAAAPSATGFPRLLPEDPWERGWVRIWSDHVSKKVVPPFYKLLQSQDAASQEAAATALLSALQKWLGAFLPSEVEGAPGPFFTGPQLGFADAVLLPFALRIEPILGHYRDFAVPDPTPAEPLWQRYHDWLTAAKAHPAVAATMSDDAPLVDIYQRYANNTSQSEVAKAMRAGAGLP